MILLFFRGAAAMCFGALAGVVALVIGYAWNPAVTLEMDRGASAVVSGLYETERAGRETFAWTKRDATLTLPGLDRTAAWTCTVRVRGGRADETTLPELSVSVDGVIATRHQTTNDYQEVTVVLPPRRSSGATVSLSSSNTVIPGPADARALGVMLDRWVCAPEGGAFVWPPRRVLATAAAGGAFFAASFWLVGLGLPAALAAASLVAVAQAVPLGWEFGMFTSYPGRAAWLAAWLAALLAVSVAAIRWTTGRPLHPAARFVAAVTFAALYLKLLILLHPSKPLIDAVFHAHRLQWVLEGRFYFTQPMPSGVRFPYAIGLYLFAAPWTLLTTDYVALLRIVVSAAEAFGGVLLYLLVSRQWRDRLAAAIAVALFQVVPRTFEIVGNANLTNAFAQSAALAALAAAVLWPLGGRDWRHTAALAGLTALALLSHISTLTLLGAILLGLAVFYWWFGGPELRASARSVLVALVAAAVFSVGVYYAHFGDAYRTAVRVRASSAAAAPATPIGADAERVNPTGGLRSRVAQAADLTVAAVGWSILLLAAVGAACRWRAGWRDRLSFAVGALAVTYLVFVTSVVLTPLERSFQRYAAEFISRVTLATYPGMVVLGGFGAAAACRSGWPGRVAATALLVIAGWVGVGLWIGWLD